MNKNITHKIPRAALTLLMMLAMSLTASATDFITDVMVAGHSNPSDFSTLIQTLQGQGWTDINYDLNKGCGSSSDYIHLLYKTQTSSGNTGVPITDFCIRTGANPPDNLTHEGRTYYLVPCQGSSSFVNSHGDLNHGASGEYIFLYYTKDALSNNTGVTAITFNTTQSGGVGEVNGNTGYDLNSGAHGSYIYMHLSTATGANVVTLSSGSGNVALQNGHILTGTGGTETQVTIADGATVTFNGVNNTAIPDNSSHQWSGISCLGNATIVLNGSTTNSVKGGRGGSGIHVAANKTLTIQGSGTLNATGGYRGAGIGSGWGDSCGNITISGGTITANGDDGAAGIGSGWQSSCGNITISGGTVTATGGASAAGIGSGYYNSSCGNITITNGVTRVTATKGQGSNNAVGAGNSSTCGTVTIGGVQTGNITMSPFVTYPYTVAFDSNGGTGTMANQVFMYNVAQNLTANAFSNPGRQFIGWATSANGNVAYTNGQSVINLTQTTITLYAKWGNTVTLTSQIGEVLLQDGEILTGTGGQNTRVKIADGATVTFNGVNNTAIASDINHKWPGISCLGDAVIVLSGGTTNSVKGGFQNSGIHVAANKTLTIQGSGTLNATGGIYAAGIGSGYNQSSCGNITISGGTVNATGGDHSAGIGSGYNNSSCGNITITNGVTCVTATKGSGSPNAIGAGYSSTCGTVTIGDVQTGNIIMSPFVTYPYTVSFDANGGTGTMADMNFMYNVARNLTANGFTHTNYVFEGWATSATGPKVYNDEQSVSNLAQNSGDTVTLFAKWIPDPTHLSVNGNAYTIHTATGWNLFCDLIAENSNGFFTGKTVELDANISVTRMAGSSGHEFSGTFDGQGHTLTVSYQNNDNNVRTAPFSYVDGATIQNLVVAGSITGTASRAAGIVGETGSNLSYVTNCLSSVNVSGGNYTAGISVGGKVEITGCVFNGTITGTNMSGGFVGWSNSALVISDCLFAPQEGSSIVGGTFYYNGGGDITPINSYYTMPLDTLQGKQAHSIAGSENVTVAFSGQATTYNVSGISACSVGMVYNNTYYAGEGDAVSLNLSCTPPSGYVCTGYQASVGTLTGSTNPYTLTMPDDDVTIQAIYAIDFIDGDGVMHTCDNYTVLTGDETTLDAGWYVVDHDITCDSPLTLNGDVTLILCNGKTMSVAPQSDGGIMDGVTAGTLTIYGQSLNLNEVGTLNVTTNYWQAAIWVGTYIQHSGNVVVSNSYGAAIDIDNITINGGSIHANGTFADGINASSLTINGGKVEASGISSSGDITLGWTNTDDYILANSYFVIDTISVKSGQAFYYEEYGEYVIVSGTLNSDQIEDIGGKTLRPRFVNYMDGNGEVHICTDYTVLTGGETTLETGWYVVDHDITYDSTLTLNGDVTLILCNHKTMTVAPNSGSGIQSTWSGNNEGLTIYGQSLDSITAGTLNVIAGDDWHNSITVTTYSQHSGKVVVGSLGDVAFYAGNCTIHGGSIEVSEGRTGIIARNNLTINGGKVEASSIWADGNITLGWTHTDDYIRSGSYNANTLSVKSGQAFYYDNNVIVSGTLNSGQIQAIDGKTLRPYPLATYTLEPTAYTLTNGGYTDITCTLSSLVLDLPVWDGSSLVQATSLSFYMHGGTLTDSIGNSIPFLVDNGSHSGAAEGMAQGGVFSSEGDTLIMAVYIDSVAYATAAPGTYTGEFVYDSYWTSADKSLPSIPGPSGSIVLTLVIPEPSTVTQVIELVEGWNWFSTYIELDDPVELLEMLEEGLGEDAIQIKSQTQATAWDEDEEEWSGRLQGTGLTNDKTYMVQLPANTTLTVTLVGSAATPEGCTIALNPNGWTWIGFPSAVELDVNEALAGFEAVDGDQLKTRTQATAWDEDEEEWSGRLNTLVPGQGYMFYSNSSEPRTLVFQTGAKAKADSFSGKHKE